MPATHDTFRDTVTVWLDDRAAGDELPSFNTQRAAGVPCAITVTTGDETWRGRQLTERIDYVVTCWMTDLTRAIKTSDQLEVTGGIYAGLRLNPKHVRPAQARHGGPGIVDILCRQATA